jgi:hypothetical protein
MRSSKPTTCAPKSTLMVLCTFASNGHVWSSASRHFVNRLLRKRLAPMATTNAPTPQVLWKHKTRLSRSPLLSMILVSNTSTRADAQHLECVLKKHYSVTCDWTGGLYCGITLKWDYIRRVSSSPCPIMSAKASSRFLHILQKYGRRRHDAPHKHHTPQYGAKVQMTAPPDNTPELSPLEKLIICKLLVSFSIMLVPLIPPCSSPSVTLPPNKMLPLKLPWKPWSISQLCRYPS